MPAFELLKSTAAPIPLETALDEISDLCARRLAIEGVEIQLEDAGGLWRRSAQGPRGWAQTCCLAFGLPLPAAGRLTEVQGASRDPRFSHWSRLPGGPEFHFFAATPLVGRSGERLGALCLTGTAERAPLTDDERRLVLRLARRCARELQSRREQADRLFAAADALPIATPVWTPEEWIAERLQMTA
jgi:GAF domain-containing protein